MRGKPPFDLHVIIDRDFLGERDPLPLIRLLIGAGVRWFQYRDKRGSDAEFAAALAGAVPLCRAEGACLIVNDRVRLAAASGADGVHLGAEDAPPSEARRLLGGGKIIGASVRSVAEAARAGAEGADYLGAGAVFPTATKPDAAPLGLSGLARICAAGRLPVVAIGGITSANVGEALAAGAAGAAVVSAVLGAHDPASAARELRQAIAAWRAGKKIQRNNHE